MLTEALPSLPNDTLRSWAQTVHDYSAFVTRFRVRAATGWLDPDLADFHEWETNEDYAGLQRQWERLAPEALRVLVPAVTTTVELLPHLLAELEARRGRAVAEVA